MTSTLLAFTALLAGQGLVSRILLLALRMVTDTVPKLLVIQGLTLSGTTLAYRQLAGGHLHWVAPALAAALWFVVDLLRLMRRRARVRDAVYISRMR